jgi:flagellar hook assembly protein FlgD
MFLERAKQIKQTAEINDLEIIKKMVKGMKLNIASRDIVVANSENKEEKYSIL